MRSEEALSVRAGCWNSVARKPGEFGAAFPARRLKRCQKIRGDENGPRPTEEHGLLQRYGDYVLMAMPYADEVFGRRPWVHRSGRQREELAGLASGMFCCVLGHNHPKFIRPPFRNKPGELLPRARNSSRRRYLEASYNLAQVTSGTSAEIHLSFYGTEANEFASVLPRPTREEQAFGPCRAVLLWNLAGHQELFQSVPHGLERLASHGA